MLIWRLRGILIPAITWAVLIAMEAVLDTLLGERYDAAHAGVGTTGR